MGEQGQRRRRAHFEAYVGATVRFNASLDDYGLQGSYTFNP
jgi:hypothetical protein